MAQTFEDVLRECCREFCRPDDFTPSPRRVSLDVLGALDLSSCEAEIRRPGGVYPIQHVIDVYLPPPTFEDDTRDMLRAVQDLTIDIATLKRLRRRYVLRHHPDRISDPEMRLRASRALSDVNVGIDDRSR